MMDLGAVSFEWGTLLFQLVTFLILLGLPAGLILYLIARSARKQKTIAELEHRIARLEVEALQQKEKEGR